MIIKLNIVLLIINKMESEVKAEKFNPEMNLFFPKVCKAFIPEEERQQYINKRVELNDSIGRILYLGPLVHKKDDKDLWVGIEWDIKSRGKHNGIVEGHVYFKTNKGKNSGSLIRLSKVNFGQFFSEAVDFKYNFYGSKENSIHQFLDKAIEQDNYIQAKQKIINIELVGKEKAIKAFSSFKKIYCIELSKCYVRNLEFNLNTLLPNLHELILTKTLLCSWTDMLKLLYQFNHLTVLNFSENNLRLDDDFDKEIEKIAKGEVKLSLIHLVLNKCKIDFYTLTKLSPIIKTVENLYLFGNQLNQKSYESNPNKKYIDDNRKVLIENLINVRTLNLERNKIKDFVFIYELLQPKQLTNLNMNQNMLSTLLGTSIEEKSELISNLKSSIKHISFDYNTFPYENLDQIMKEIEYLELLDVDILNNSSIDKLGFERAKFEIVGRNPKLEVLNNTTITKILRRDYEKLYLNYSVETYFKLDANKAVTEQTFDINDFTKYMQQNHQQYFKLKKKFYDPLDDFMLLLQKKTTNTIKGNMIEVVLIRGEKEIKKKFPQTTTFANLRNLCTKLFKMENNEHFSFYISFTSENEELVSDESTNLNTMSISNAHKIILK